MAKFFWWRATTRANRETCRFLGIGKPKRLFVSAILSVLAVIALKFIGVTGQMNEEWRWVVAVIVAAVILYVPMFMWNLLKAPGRMEKETAEKYRKQADRLETLEQEKIPRIEVHPFGCKPSLYEQIRYSTWAELQIKNTSVSPLQEVSVQIQDCVEVYKVQDGPDKGKYFLETMTQWRPANVYWSESNAIPRQLTASIPAGATINAVVAFHGQTGYGLGTFNTPTPSPFIEKMVAIEVSSPSINTWRGKYYIGYHPPGTDRFEFVEWDEWRKAHEVIEQSAVRREDSQLQ